MNASVSIIICTRNRAESLRATLQGVSRLTVPEGYTVELLTVDNGSTDHTQAVIKETRLSNMNHRHVGESKIGISNARNAGLAAASGEIILFTDDDVTLDRDWLGKITVPLVEGKCDAVMGTIYLDEHLLRPWMTPVHKIWLAATGRIFDCAWELTGANMGFYRNVLRRVPAFDPELGGGAMGFGEDSLFSWQLSKAGYRLHKVSDAFAIHHPEPSRLLRSQWLAAACKRGQSTAYLFHHWQHGELKYPLVRACYFASKLHSRRFLQPPASMDAEGCAPWEMSYVHTIEMCRQYIKERQRPRNYTKCGLVRLEMRSQTGLAAAESRSGS